MKSQKINQLFLENSNQSHQYTSLTEHENQKVLVEWNETEKDYPRDKTIHQLFEEQVEKTPDCTAIVFEDTSLTYRELNEKANQLAHFLKEKGIKPDMLVAIACDRSTEMIIGILAILKAGGAYVPLDPNYPMERLSYMMDDVKAPILLTQLHLIDQLPKTKAEIVFLEDSVLFKDYPISNLECTAQSHQLAYVIYTSGSTGKPKGVMIEHKGCVVRILYMINKNEMSSQDSLLFKTNLIFDVSFSDIFCTLISGATLCITKEVFNIDEIKNFLINFNISICHFIPSQFSFIKQDIDFGNLTKLRKLMFSGEALDINILQCLAEKNKIILNYYGPTETGEVTLNKFNVNNLFSEVSYNYSNIGKPFDGSAAYVLDTNLKPLPIEVIGELYIGGISIARGYLNRPELTAERFIENPFQTEEEKSRGDNARLYRTGDLVRWTPNGDLIYVGRIDEQVKLRGFRIELGEIESILKQNLEIKDVVVIVREDVPGDKKLAAYVILKKDHVDIEMLRSFLKDKLPEYMIPSAFVMLDFFPLTPSGKIDKKKLPKPVYENTEKYVESQTETEKVLVNIWEETLKTNKIGVHSDFFSLGGHSLLAANIAMKINKFFNVKLNMGDVLNNTTIAALAYKIESLPKVESNFQKLTAFSGEKVNIPITYSQEQIWFHLQGTQGESIYNEPWTITMRMQTSHASLEKSVNEIVKRHEILRARISLLKGTPVQTIIPYLFFELPFIDLSYIEDQEKCYEKACRIATIEAEKSFDLERDQLIRFVFIKLTDNLYKLYIVAHHIIIDGISFYKILFPELIKLYKSFSNNTLPHLPKIDFQYTDYSLWNQNRIVDYSKESHFWKKTLQGYQDISFGRTKLGFKGKRETLVFNKKLNEELFDFSCQYGTTRFVVFLTVLNVLLYKYTGQDDLCVVSSVSCRNQLFLENVCGYFLNSVIFRNHLSGDPTFSEFLAKVNQNALSVYENQELPLQKVSELIRNKNNDKLPLSIWLVLEPPLEQNELNWELSQLEIHTNTAKFPLTIELDERSGGIIGRVEYNTDLFSQSFIQRFIEHFNTILQSVISDPNVKISNIGILSREEKQKVLVEWNETEKDYPKDKTIHQLFEEQVEKTPDCTAIVFEDTSLTYRELNEKANQLAHFLKEKGIKPDMLVAIACDRSTEMIIGILAILKAGGAYVPLDPNYPMERLSYMMDDIKAPILLTQLHLIDQLPKTKAEIVFLEDSVLFKYYPISNLECTAQSHHLAYVIYTSGSTGKPKGVMIEHESICDRLFWWQDYASLTSEDCYLHQFSFSFDGAVVSLWWPLLNGSTVIIPTSQGLSNGAYLTKLIKRYKITALLSTPSMVNLILDHQKIYETNHIRKLMLAGEVFPRDVLEKAQKLQACQIYNFYGPTESTIIATSYEITNKDCITSTVPIGYPVANTQVYILDSYFYPVPVGVIGELYIGGNGLARGYLNQPELTAERFIENPFLEEDDKIAGRNLRLYKTGDLCRWLENGNVEYIGRIDEQVKLRGFRIELGEIEFILRQHSEIKDAIAILREDTPGDKRLAAYIVFKKDHVDTEMLRSFLKDKLPEYMIPSAFMTLDCFPLTPNGKIDKKELPKPVYQNIEKYVEPKTEIEKALSQIVKEILTIEEVSINDNLFDLGLNSLNIFRLIALSHERGMKISIQQLNTFNTIGLLSHSIRNDLKGQRLVHIRKNNELLKDCIVFLPPAGGSIDIFNHLIKKIDYPMISAIQFIEEDLKETSIQTLAEKIANLLCQEMPNTRYTLIGHSFGGMLAYEVAQILEEHKLSRVFMLDTSPLSNNHYKITGDLKLYALSTFAIINGMSTNHISQLMNDLTKLADDSKIAYAREMMSGRFTTEQIESFTNFYISTMEKIKKYQYTPNQRNIEFIFCRAQDQSMFKNSYGLFSSPEGIDIPYDDGLSEIINNLKVFQVSGNHVSMLREPHVESLAKIISQYLPVGPLLEPDILMEAAVVHK